MRYSLFILALLLCGLAIGFGCEKGGAPSDVTTEESDASKIDLPPCGEGPLFTVLPFALDDVSTLAPLGNFKPPDHTFPTDHIYFYIKCTFDAETKTTECPNPPVYSPGHVWITSVSTTEYTESTHYDISFSPCAEVSAAYYHLKSPPQELLDQIGAFEDENCSATGTGGNSYPHCWKNVNIELEAGELIGQGQGGITLDFGLADSRTAPLAYANPDRYYSYGGIDSLHIACPIDYYSEDLREQLRAKLRENRTVEPICGEVMQDVPGTAQGNWFLVGAEDAESGKSRLALAHSNFDSQEGAFLKGVFSVGATISGLPSRDYHFTPTSSGLVKRDFSQVTADGQVYCYGPFTYYEVASYKYRTILIQLTGDTTLRIKEVDAVADGCGEGPWEFGSDYTDFER